MWGVRGRGEGEGVGGGGVGGVRGSGVTGCERLSERKSE